MDLEKIVKEEMEKAINDGIVAEKAQKYAVKAVEEVTSDLFGYNSEFRRRMRAECEKAMLPIIENYNFENLIPKLDAVLSDVVSQLKTSEYKRILERFKTLVTNKADKKILLSEVFDEYCDYCSKNIDTDNVETCDEGYCYLNCKIEVTKGFSYNYSNTLTIKFSCKEDEELNKEIRIHLKLSAILEDDYDIYEMTRMQTNINIPSLRYIDDFELFILEMQMQGAEVVKDIESSQEAEVDISI